MSEPTDAQLREVAQRWINSFRDKDRDDLSGFVGEARDLARAVLRLPDERSEMRWHSVTALKVQRDALLREREIGESYLKHLQDQRDALLAGLRQLLEAAEGAVREAANAHGETSAEFILACTTGEKALVEAIAAARRLVTEEA